jgi:hypothetical protein
MSKKGQKNQRGQPEKWDELKKRVMLSLTPTSVDGLDAIAHGLGISRSELVERIGRGVISIHLDTFDNSGGAT